MKATEEETKEWLRSNCPDIPTILIERESHIMDAPMNFTTQLQNNKNKSTGLTYGVP